MLSSGRFRVQTTGDSTTDDSKERGRWLGRSTAGRRPVRNCGVERGIVRTRYTRFGFDVGAGPVSRGPVGRPGPVERSGCELVRQSTATTDHSTAGDVATARSVTTAGGTTTARDVLTDEIDVALGDEDGGSCHRWNGVARPAAPYPFVSGGTERRG